MIALSEITCKYYYSCYAENMSRLCVNFAQIFEEPPNFTEDITECEVLLLEHHITTEATIGSTGNNLLGDCDV